jgi:hypothetical protein
MLFVLPAILMGLGAQQALRSSVKKKKRKERNEKGLRSQLRSNSFVGHTPGPGFYPQHHKKTTQTIHQAVEHLQIFPSSTKPVITVRTLAQHRAEVLQLKEKQKICECLCLCVFVCVCVCVCVCVYTLIRK